MLQTRNGKRTGGAALQVAWDLVHEGLVTKDEAICMVEPRHLDQLLHPMFEDEKAYVKDVFAHGLAASPGVFSAWVCACGCGCIPPRPQDFMYQGLGVRGADTVVYESVCVRHCGRALWFAQCMNQGLGVVDTGCSWL